MNKVFLCGNLGKDPESKQIGDRLSTKFSMATTEKFKGKDGSLKEDTQWHNCVLWGPLAEAAQKHLVKGSKVLVTGKVTQRSWETDGKTNYITEIQVDSMEILTWLKPKEDAAAPAAGGGGAEGGHEVPW